jgi:arabinose-5-phosphate isomerase
MGPTPSKALKDRIFLTLEKQVEAVSGLAKSNSDIIKAIFILSSRKGNIIVTGVGKSAFIGMKIAATFTSLGHPACFLHPVDALHGDSGILKDGDAIIAISFSGESAETVKIIKYIKKTFSLKVIAITGNKNSSLNKMSDASIILAVRGEGSPHGLAPMASTTASLVAGDLLAAGLVDPKKYKGTHFAKFHPGGNLGLKLKSVGEVMLTGIKVPKINKEASFKKAILEINRKKKGVVGIVDSRDKLIGVITDGDVRRFFVQHDSSSGILAKDVMTERPKVIDVSDSLETAFKVMENSKITNLFVTNKFGKVLGVIHLHDIIEATS